MVVRGRGGGGAAFKSPKETLCTAHVISRLQPAKFTIDIDASDVGIGGAVSKLEDGQ
jgi:hypothetical protein